jgi:Tol biopolymer transport system component
MMGYPQGLAWSADGTRLVVANDSGDGGGLWQLTLSGELSRLPFGEEASAPAVAGRSTRIAYVRVRKTVDIWRVDLSASQPEAAASKLIVSSRAEMTPQYSPDSTRIAFQSNRSGAAEVWFADAAGENPVRLTSFNGPLTGAPNWCSDGRRIAFDSRVDRVSSIYIADIHQRLPRKLKTNRENLALPAWSEDCKWIVASDGQSALFRIPAAGGKAVRFTQQPSYYAQMSGDRVVFNVKEAQGVALWSKPIQGGAEQPLENMPGLTYSDAWTATAAGIYYTTSPPGSSSIHFYDFATRATRHIAQLPNEPIPAGGLGLSVSQGGRWALYTRANDAQSDIMLMYQSPATSH